MAILITDNVCVDRLGRVAETILARRREHPSSSGGNVRGGWKSPYGVFSWTDDLVVIGRTIAEQLVQMGLPAKLLGWAMIHDGNGSDHPRHIHGNPVTGVLCVTPGNPAAPTIFERAPVYGAPARIGETDVVPIPGRLVLTTTKTWHRVPPYHGTEPRITIAFDAVNAI